MTLCTKLIKYKQATCVGVSGGVAQIFAFDPQDFNFTQAAPVSGVIQPYTALTDLSTGTGYFYPISFMRNMANYSFKQSSKGGYTSSYKHQLQFQVADLSMLTAQWNAAIDAAGVCCGVGLVIVLNSGRILIAGEYSVNTNVLPVPFFWYQDGSSADSGKTFEDLNSNTVVMVGDYKRPLVEYTGALSTILALQAP